MKLENCIKSSSLLMLSEGISNFIHFPLRSFHRIPKLRKWTPYSTSAAID